MIAALKRRFTKWYVAKGYGFRFDPFHMRPIYTFPLWVRPLRVFFSPSVYKGVCQRFCGRHPGGGI